MKEKLQNEVKESAKQWKEKFYIEKSMKEEEVMKVNRQVEECLCRNVCNVCSKNLSREESETGWKTTFNK